LFSKLSQNKISISLCRSNAILGNWLKHESVVEVEVSAKPKRRRTATKRHFDLEDFDDVKSDDLPLKRSSRKTTTKSSRVKKSPKRTQMVEESAIEDDDDFMQDFNESIKVSFTNLTNFLIENL
jgi:hypothetical protein